MRKARTLSEHLAAYVRPGRPDECWPWTGYVNAKGYGRLLRGQNGRIYAHRAAWVIANGPIPDGLILRHACDNPACCNPAHLLLGTYQDNVNDAVSRRRHSYGERAPQARLTLEQVLAIRALLSEGMSQPQVAARFGMSRSAIGHIAQGSTWRTALADLETEPTRGHIVRRETREDVTP